MTPLSATLITTVTQPINYFMIAVQLELFSVYSRNLAIRQHYINKGIIHARYEAYK